MRRGRVMRLPGRDLAGREACGNETFMRQILFIFGLLLTMTGIGALGLRLIEGAPWLDCCYMAVITITTVGYTDQIDGHPLSDAGRIFIMVYLISGIGIVTYSLFQLGQWVVSAQLHSVWEKRQMEHALQRLNRHYIVCGLGRMGTTIAQYLQARKQPFVIIDTNEQRLVPLCKEHGWLYIVGDATHDDVLLQAGIDRAKSLATVLPTDADNVYVVLSATLLNSQLQVIARASDDQAAQKMERAGATRVVSPFSTGAVKMARFMLHPSIEDFLEIADGHGRELELADVQISVSSPYVGKKLMETDLREKGVMVVGIRRANGERLMPPPGTAMIEVGDCLFAFGSSEAVNLILGERD